MKRIIEAQLKPQISEALRWLEIFLEPFDVSKVDWLRIDSGRGGYGGCIYGRCHWPIGRGKKRKNFRISCQIDRPKFPYHIHTRKRPLYRNEDGSWPETPQGCAHGAHVISVQNGVEKHWIRLTGTTVIHNINEGAVWILAHEFFHFLRKTRQVDGINTEIEADAFADSQLRDFSF